LTIWTQAEVEKLTFGTEDDGQLRCTGLRLNHDRHSSHITAKREVIVSAGAINSPKILQLSGIGPANLLRSKGIEVILDAPVGENLQDHLQIRAVFKVTGTQTLNTLSNSVFGKIKIGAEYLLKRSGPMSMSPSQLGRLHPL
jgi:choline dehydrogenase